MLKNILKFSGMAIILIFCALSIFFSLIHREVKEKSLKELTSYSAFFEDRFYDWRMKKTMDPKKREERITLLNIDDRTLKNLGRWPLSREVWSRVVDKLYKHGAKIVAFDIFFSESELACHLTPPDELFAKSISQFQSKPGNKVIIPYGAVLTGEDTFKRVPDAMLDFMLKVKQTRGIDIYPSKISKAVYPLDKIIQSSPALGFIRAEKDQDGLFRMYPLVANINGLFFPSFPLIIYQAYKGKSAVLDLSSSEEKYIVTENAFFDVNFKGETKVRWLGGKEHFNSLPVHEFLEMNDDNPLLKNLIENKIIFIGSTAYGAHDLRNTPIHSELPGVYFHMNMTHMILEGLNFRPAGKSTYLSWLILLGTSLIMIMVMAFQSATLDIFVAIAMATGLMVTDIYYLTPQGYQVKLFFCLLSIISCYLWGTTVEFYATTKEKKKIRSTFSRFVSPDVVNDMLEHPEHVKIGGESREITVFFSDIRNFTEISAKLNPKVLSQYINRYMGKMTKIIFENHGTLDKYIGDAIVAFWGAPLNLEHHPYHALKSALKMIDIIPELNNEYKKEGLPELQHGIGINTGECSVGNMGSEKIFSYTAIGENMNLGSRLEKLCKHYGIQLHISEFTYNALTEEQKKEFKIRPMDVLKMAGKDAFFRTFQVLESEHPFSMDDEALEKFTKAFDLHQKEENQKAFEFISEVMEKYPNDRPTKILYENCKYSAKKSST